MKTFDSATVRTLLADTVGEYPVDHAAAAVVSPEMTATFGDDSRVYELASVTKLVVAWATMMAVEEGFFALDDAIGEEGATLRQLLAHAGGVGFATRTMEKPAGTRRIYSSAGYEMIAEAIEREAGMPFAEYLHETVFAPLGMNTAELHGSAGHGMRASLADMVAFAGEVLTPTLLDPITVATMMTVQLPDLEGVVPGFGMQRPCPWGLGFEIHGYKEPHWLPATMPPHVAGHFGQAGTYFWIDPAMSVAMVMLTDRAFGDWAKPLWAPTNERIYTHLSRRTN
ncbi:serine hydrolase domain-containing protein [Corynebacterium choanae]|uniref:serine hydrolase domain-containing protein n=1 Tax=Corynebacterium choanae TaxID=1862358 RepID=UPI00360D7C08